MKRIGAIITLLSLVTTLEAKSDLERAGDAVKKTADKVESYADKKVIPGANAQIEKGKSWIKGRIEANPAQVDWVKGQLEDLDHIKRQVTKDVKGDVGVFINKVQEAKRSTFHKIENSYHVNFDAWTKRKEAEATKEAPPATDLGVQSKIIGAKAAYAKLSASWKKWQNAPEGAEVPTLNSIINDLENTLRATNINVKELDRVAGEDGKNLLHLVIEDAYKREQNYFLKTAKEEQVTPLDQDQVFQLDMLLAATLCECSQVANSPEGKSAVDYLIAQERAANDLLIFIAGHDKTKPVVDKVTQALDRK
jgi:hypothetical protein